MAVRSQADSCHMKFVLNTRILNLHTLFEPQILKYHKNDLQRKQSVREKLKLHHLKISTLEFEVVIQKCVQSHLVLLADHHRPKTLPLLAVRCLTLVVPSRSLKLPQIAFQLPNGLFTRAIFSIILGAISMARKICT